MEGRVATCVNECLRQNIFHVSLQTYAEHGVFEQLVKVGRHNPRVQRCLEFLTAYKYTIKHGRGETKGYVDLLCRLPLLPTAADTSPICRPAEPNESKVCPRAI